MDSAHGCIERVPFMSAGLGQGQKIAETAAANPSC